MKSFKLSIVAFALSAVTANVALADQNYLPSQFSESLQQGQDAKRKLTAAEKKALDDEILKATASNLPLANKAIMDGQMPSVDQQGRLQAMQGTVNGQGHQTSSQKIVTQKGNSLIAQADSQGNTLNAYPQYSAPQQSYQQPIISAEQQASNAVVDKALEIFKPKVELMAAPGEPVTIAVGVAQSNRIGFNFNKLEVVTSDMRTPILKDGGYMYITPSVAGEPIGLLVGEEGMPETMVNVLLLPANVPQVIAQVDVLLTKEMKQKRSRIIADAKAKEAKAAAELAEIEEQLEQGESKLRTNTDPYSDRIIDLLTMVAKEDIPQGFSLRLQNQVPEKDLYPCDSTKLVMYHQTVQQLESSKEIIDIVKVTNDLNGVRSVEDDYCISPGVLAAATFRRSHLQPGQSTEIYVLRDKLYSKKHLKAITRKRPSVTN
ncbi:hypothetical protein REH81_11775 [Vibrio rotiferianus]